MIIWNCKGLGEIDLCSSKGRTHVYTGSLYTSVFYLAEVS
jgi:hypothetical protein